MVKKIFQVSNNFLYKRPIDPNHLGGKFNLKNKNVNAKITTVRSHSKNEEKMQTK